MTPWDGKERREMNRFEREVIDRLARIEQKQTDKDGRCDAHSKEIVEHAVRIDSLEGTRTAIQSVWSTTKQIAIIVTTTAGTCLAAITIIKYIIKHAG